MIQTAENAYAGQAGAYIITEPEEDALGLPSGYGEYDIPLVLGAKQYNADGSLFSLVNEDVSLWGDVIHVNGQPWPYMDVEPRKYRFRFLNAAVSRSFALYFAATAAVNAALPFKVISSDTGLLSDPVQVSNLVSLTHLFLEILRFISISCLSHSLLLSRSRFPAKRLCADKVFLPIVHLKRRALRSRL